METGNEKINLMATKPEIHTKEQVAEETETLVAEEGQVIVHCICSVEGAYRIWPTTYLVELGSGKRSRLLTAYNISFYPHWTLKNAGQRFTLIFEGLSRNCFAFDLIEEIPQEGGFEVPGIARTSNDVYMVELG